MKSRNAALFFLAFALYGSACTVGAGQPKDSTTATQTASLSSATESTLRETPTGTHTAIPATRTPTPAPAPRTFTEAFYGGLPNWSFLQINNGQSLAAPVTRDGFLVFDLPGANQWAYALYGRQEYRDVIVETSAQFRAGNDGAIGIVCRYDEQKGWYELNVFADQTYVLLYGKWLATGVAQYLPLFQGRSEAIQTDTNSVGLECVGNMLTPFFNGVQTRKWQELKFGLQRGKIGLAVSSFSDAPFSAALDWVKVREP